MNETAPFEFADKAFFLLDPRTKLLLTVTVSTIMVAGGTGGMMSIIRPCLMACPILLLLFSRKWKTAIRFAVIYIIMFILELTVLSLLNGFWNFLLGAVVGIYTHMLPGFIMGYYLIRTTTVSEFIAAMEKMRVSPKVVIPVSVVFRFFPTVKEEYAAIQDAMKMRGITFFQNPIKMLEYRVVPLMISLSKIGEELSAAALTRGLGAPVQRTNICRIGFGLPDIFFILLSVGCWIAFVLVRGGLI